MKGKDLNWDTPEGVRTLERQGFLTDYDARELAKDAARSDIP